MKYVALNLDEARELGLSLEAATLLAGIRYNTKRGKTWTLGCRLSAVELVLRNKDLAHETFKELLSKGLIERTDNGYIAASNIATVASNIATGASNIATVASNIATVSKEERTKEENKEINKSLSIRQTNNNKDGQADGLFDEEYNNFWLAFNPLPKYNNRKKRCYEDFWKKMPSDWKKQALLVASIHDADANPYFWLKDEAYLRVDIAQRRNNQEDKCEVAPTWLSAEEVAHLIASGTIKGYCVCRNVETGLTATCTISDAERFGLEKIRDW